MTSKQKRKERRSRRIAWAKELEVRQAQEQEEAHALRLQIAKSFKTPREAAGQKVVAYNRGSSDEQHPKRALRAFIGVLKESGAKVIAKEATRETGKSLNKEDRPSLHKLAMMCRETGAWLGVPGFSRLLRHPEFNAIWNKEVEPTLEQLRELAVFLEGLTVVSGNNPMATCEQDRLYLTQSEEKGRTRAERRKIANRPEGYKKEKRGKLQEVAKEMRTKGASLHKIAKELGIPYSTIRKWVQ